MDWARLHAALNDLPAALLLAAVLFDLLGAINRRESLRAAGFWCLIGGVAGGALAAVAGLKAEDAAVHGEAAHALMESHQTLAFIVFGLFGLLAAWRVVRRAMAGREQVAFTTAGVIGVALLVITARMGGDLVFEHAAGLDGHTLQHAIEERQGGASHHHDEEGSGQPADSMKAHHDSAGHSH